MAGTSSGQDEVFGLPFLFTGGLPNSLERFSEGNLRCFLIYLIEVVGKANRQNVWLKPAWWKSRLIPYSPISVDTSRVPQEQVVKELRSLVENCYKFYNAEKILEVSRQLSGIPRILLGIRDNKNNTMTVYDTNSKAVYVTVRPENLFYDEKSLDKVSKDWRDNYKQEDVTFCEIKKATDTENKVEMKSEGESSCVIEVIDSDDEDDKSTTRRKLKTESPARRQHRPLRPTMPMPCKSSRIGTVVRSGDKVVISLSDSEDEGSRLKAEGKVTGPTTAPPVQQVERSGRVDESKSKKEDDVEFVCEYYFSRPCPKRFKQQFQIPKQVTTESPSVIILSDSDGENDDSSIYISSYTSLAKNFSNVKFFPETPNKNIQKSILGPLICSPRKVGHESQRVSQLLSPQLKRSSSNISASKKSPVSHPPIVKKLVIPPTADRSKSSSSDSEASDDDDDDFQKPTKEELFLLKKKKNRTFYPSSPPCKKRHVEPLDFKVHSQAEFMTLLGMNWKKKGDGGCVTEQADRRPRSSSQSETFLSVLRSMRASTSRMPLDWIRVLSSNNHIILSKRSSRTRQFDPTQINYEPYCSTDRTFVEYSIKNANASVQKERRSDSRQTGRKGTDKNSFTLEKWFNQNEEASQRRKRASLRMLRSLTMGEQRVSPVNTLSLGTLAPTLQRLPSEIFERALQMTLRLRQPV